MQFVEQNMERGIEYWKKGKREEARNIFASIVQSDQQNEFAWVWYIFSLESAAEKVDALELFLNIFPRHSIGMKALEHLKEETQQLSPPLGMTKVVPQKDTKMHRIESSPVQRLQPVRGGVSASITWLLACAVFSLLVGGAIFFTLRIDALQVELQALKASNQIVEKNFAELGVDFQSLKSTNSNLIYEYNNLDGKLKKIRTEYSQLAENFDALAGDYDALNNVAIKPPYIVIHDREVDSTFIDTDGQLISWVTPFSSFEDDIEKGARTRSLVINENWRAVEVSTMDGSRVWVRDFSIFITPESFLNGIPEIYRKSTVPYDFIYRIWSMIGQLANYASEDLETPRYPLETLLAGGGDCEDLAILLASMIKAAPVDWSVDLLYLDLDNLQNPENPNHIVVYIDTGQESFIVETTSDQNMLPFDEGVTGWLAGNFQTSGNPRPVSLP